MSKSYFERRISSARGTDSASADIMRHLHARQYLGKTLVVCEQPIVMLSSCRKQWFKLSRVIQRQRASTLNADKILKYTHTIAHMQRMHFTTKEPLQNPNADVFFLTPEQLSFIPLNCYQAYIIPKLPLTTIQHLVAGLPADGLIIDYQHSYDWPKLGLQSKKVLEKRVQTTWQDAQVFLKSYNIETVSLYTGVINNISAMDDALDTLLGVSHKFILVADEFQRALELARPVRLNKELRHQYDSFMLLAHRVQALSNEKFSQRFLEIYNEDDTFFLYDNARRRALHNTQDLSANVAQQQAAGHYNLAKAMANTALSFSTSV